ncbi:hypothetical protein ACJDU8_01055 [Clostridium sp. WILCCON 0269]|uniref:TetR family transcriptional regulator n=1 Tax=Candidatus Clostridium eludens TaxID=3381663 RepID=A0ABW8SG14_9CLOT
MKAISNEMIKDTVDQAFVEKIVSFSEIDIYKATSGMPKEGVRLLVFINHLILEWIKEVVNGEQELVTPETKIRIIEEIFNAMDKYMDGES